VTGSKYVLLATDGQTDFPVLYAIGRQGIAKNSLEDRSDTLEPLFDMILKRVPPPIGDPLAPLQILVNNLDHDDYTGRLAIGRVVAGTARANQPVMILKDGMAIKGSIKVLSIFEGLRRAPVAETAAGEIIAIAGIEDVFVGDTIADASPGFEDRALPRIHVEQPTIKMRIGVNTSPFAGRCKQSKFLTSRQLRDDPRDVTGARPPVAQEAVLRRAAGPRRRGRGCWPRPRGSACRPGCAGSARRARRCA